MAAKTHQSRAEYAADMDCESDSNQGQDEDYTDLDVEQAARLSRQQRQESLLATASSENGNDWSELVDGVYATITTTNELQNPIQFPTTEINPAIDLSALVQNNAMAGAAKLATTTYQQVIGGSTIDQHLVCRHQRIANVDELRTWSLPVNKSRQRRPMAVDNGSEDDDSEENFDGTFPVLPSAITTTRVTLLDSALDINRTKFRPRTMQRGVKPDTLEDHPFIDDVSYAFGLKYRQHVAFVTMACALLQTWRSRIADSHPSNTKPLSTIIEGIHQQQLLFFLYGCGGTGKSHVIDAVQAFCNAWERPNSIAKLAMTGKAAVGISGVTLHSWIGMHNLEPTTTHEESSARAKGVPGFTEDLCLIIIDEISMMNKDTIGQT